MASHPTLFSLFWNTLYQLGGGQNASLELGKRLLFVPAALQLKVRVVIPPPLEAIILWPAFLTPAICREEAAFQLLLLAPKPVGTTIPEINPYLVNQRLKVSRGLNANRIASTAPLFRNPAGLIEVSDPLALSRDAPMELPSAFRGIVDARYWDNLDAWVEQRKKVTRTADRPPFEVLYKVKVDVSCLRNPIGAETAPGEYAGDQLLQSVLKRRNGKRLGGQVGDGAPVDADRGLHCFPVSGGGGERAVDLSSVDLAQPVRSHHPLFVYQADGLATLAVGHIADLHLNSRQAYLSRSPARVVETDPQNKHDPMASPPLGSKLNVYADNVVGILGRLGAMDADVVLVGGDLIDHVKNVFPYDAADPKDRDPMSVRQVWDLMDLKDDDRKEKNYQAFVDHLTFYSIARHFCEAYQRPMFVITGNHDAYSEPFGISPRVFGLVKGNEGIPADHNLTFYEAILAFGPSYAQVPTAKMIWLHKELFEWFHAMFTPFRDFAVDLPKHRIVGLAWGEDEGKIDVPPLGHGATHLPRATESPGAPQWDLLTKAVSDPKRVVLFTHYTFVSYIDTIPNSSEGKWTPSLAPQPGKLSTVAPEKRGAFGLRPLSLGSLGTFSDCDYGTFETMRSQMYGQVATGKLQAVFTGHSHRKGLYYLREPLSWFETGYTTEMYSLYESLDRAAEPLAKRAGATPIIVSDSAGPLPRLNHHNEFLEWGSDRPSGTLAKFDANGEVEGIEAVRTTIGRTKPRVAVALDYLRSEKKIGITQITSDEFPLFAPDKEFDASDHILAFRFEKGFPWWIAKLARVRLHGLATRGEKWSRLQLDTPNEVVEKAGSLVVTFTVPKTKNADLRRWMALHGKPRFVSLAFSSRRTDPLVDAVYDFGDEWVLPATSTVGFVGSVAADGDGQLDVPTVGFYSVDVSEEIPDFSCLRDYLSDYA